MTQTPSIFVTTAIFALVSQCQLSRFFPAIKFPQVRGKCRGLGVNGNTTLLDISMSETSHTMHNSNGIFNGIWSDVCIENN